MQISEISLLDIVNRKLEYIENSDVYMSSDFVYVKEGESKAYREILTDIEVQEEQEFIEKYLKIIVEINEKLEMMEYRAGEENVEIEQLTGYNNAIVSVLMLLHPKYEFELE